MSAAPDPGYDAGVIAGRTGQRLSEHDRHFEAINGSVEKSAAETRKLREELTAELHALILAVQRLADSAAADRATAVTLAAALKDADEARRSTTETRWSPMARLITVLVCLAALVSTVVLILRR